MLLFANIKNLRRMIVRLKIKNLKNQLWLTQNNLILAEKKASTNTLTHLNSTLGPARNDI